MEAVFRGSERGRGAYLSRLFAFFSEEVVRHWSACEQAPYRDVGRPVIRRESELLCIRTNERVGLPSERPLRRAPSAGRRSSPDIPCRTTTTVRR